MRSNMFREFAFSPNAERDWAFGSGPRPNFELNFGSVQIGSGLNLSSEPNFYNPTHTTPVPANTATVDNTIWTGIGLNHNVSYITVV